MGMQIRVRDDGVLEAVPDVGQGYAYRATGVPTGGPPIYGAGGLFGVCGAHPTLINACVNPIGIEAWFEWVGSNVESPIYDALTSIQSSGYAQASLCGDCGTPSFEECSQSACFGRLCQMTNEHAFDDLGMVLNRGVPQLALFGDITEPDGTVILRRGQPITDNFTLDLIGAAYNLRARLATEIWVGNPAANLGGHMEFPGIQLIVNTGKVDALTGLACDALDSRLHDYGSAVVGAVGSPSIVAHHAALFRSINYRAARAGFDVNSIERAIVVHPTHWDCLADSWACEYGLTCQNTTASAAVQQDAMEVAKLRDEFLRGQYVRIDGHEVPVILDSQIPLTVVPYGNGTSFCGDQYQLVKRVGGQTIFWGEYQNFQQTAGNVLAWFRQMFNSNIIAVTDGGRFAIAPTTAGGFCFDARILTKNRLLCIMPWLQARLQNVCCVPTGFYPDATGSGGAYEVGGGPSTKPYLGLYGPCGWEDEARGGVL